ncbi:MAG TPA: peroxiredoxin [Steroidobacteraceae bacterium]|nr:peroxiredoxin [Steroidobacteraceae bacterium]
MLATGTKAPDFTLPDHEGRDRTLTELLRSGPLILYFYPADFTPGCTKEACSLRDLHDEILRAGLRVVGVSPQDAASHERFRQQHSLPFTLLSDVDKKAVRAYDVDGPLGIGVRRATYLIDQNGQILDGVLADLRIQRHEEFVRRAVAARSS